MTESPTKVTAPDADSGLTATGVTEQAAAEAWLSSVFEEYRALRQEVLTALQTHLSTLRYGITAASVLTGLAVQLKESYLGAVIALVVVPLVIVFAAVTWMGEFERMARAGRFIAELEIRVNGHFPLCGRAPPLQWETWLREGDPDTSRQARARHRYFAILMVFIALDVIAVGIGLTEAAHQLHGARAEKWLAMFAASLFNVIVISGLVLYFRTSYARLREYAVSPANHGGGP